MAPTNQDASFLSKLVVLLGLLVSSAVTVMLLLWSERDSSALHEFVTQHPTQVQVLIQVVAHLLGFIHVFTLSTITNFSTRRRLRQGSVSLARLRLWQSISSINFVWNLPLLQTGILLSYLLLHLLPATLWAAVLAPIPSESTTMGALRLASYPPDPSGESWNGSSGPVVRNEKRIFSWQPALARVLHGPIFNTASTAPSVDRIRVHDKNDNTQQSYVGRSYGVGASVGLEDLVLDSGDQQTPLLYRYQELGYVANVTCTRNESSAWGVHHWLKGSSPAFPDAYLACGVLANSLYEADRIFSDSECPGLIPGFRAEWFAVLAISKSMDRVFALQGVSNGSTHMFATATGNKTYNALDKVQCETQFIPQIFQVSVNISSCVIQVEPIANSTTDMDPSAATYGAGLGLIPRGIVAAISSLCSTTTALYNSAMGDSFISNIQNVATTRNASVDDTSVILDGVSTALESMIDDVLLAWASAQIEIAWKQNDVTAATTTTVPTVTIATMHVGKFLYVAIVAAVNFLIVAAYFVELLRTRAWRGMPVFDYNDVASMAVAASMGGTQLGAAVAFAHENVGNAWTGAPGEMEGANAKISLRFEKGRPTIAVARPLEDDEQWPLRNADENRRGALGWGAQW
ncbi:hypothetical protein C8R43DRAFT_1233401 [Mycena crocata]|nr:hypothetical protein C8R43DRAFT_1233401 [Mycena crocata]